MTTPSDEKVDPGTTPYYANMHKWIKRAVLVCLIALVVEGAFTHPRRAGGRQAAEQNGAP